MNIEYIKNGWWSFFQCVDIFVAMILQDEFCKKIISSIFAIQNHSKQKLSQLEWKLSIMEYKILKLKFEIIVSLFNWI